MLVSDRMVGNLTIFFSEKSNPGGFPGGGGACSQLEMTHTLAQRIQVYNQFISDLL